MGFESRISGLMVGAAVGDALGAPFEFGSSGEYARRFPEPQLGEIGEMIGGGGFNWAPGEFTDDTQMAVVLAESLLKNNLQLHRDHLWSQWRAWAADARDVGMTTHHSLSFERWQDVTHANPAMTAANGTLMRVFPLAIPEMDSATRKQMVLDQAALTHPHPDAGYGAWLGVAMMRAAIEEQDPFVALEQELDALPADSRAAFADAIAQNWISAAGLISNGTIWGCSANAVWAVRGATSYEQAVVRAINSGGDTDTVACVAGAIAGAMYTEQGIPSRWLAYVHGTTNGSDVYRLEDLENLARALAGASTPRPSKEPLVTPVEVFPNLYAANRSGAETAPKDWAVVSLCRTEGFFVGHEVRRQTYLLDNSHGNPSLDHAVGDAIATIDALLAEGRKVVVHCEGGRSRTCLALKAWWMTTTGGTHAQAREWLQSSWTMCSDQNPSFIDFLDNFEPQS